MITPLDIEGFRFHHIGVAVNDIEITSKFYEATGWQRTIETAYDPEQNVRACFYTQKGFPKIELIEGVDDNSPTNKILAKSGVSPYHICYGVDDISDAIRQLKMLRFMPTGRPVPSVGMPGCKVCFLYNREYGLIELVENENVIKRGTDEES